MPRQPIARRTFLRGTSAALGLPLLDVMRPSSARAAAASTPPKRFVSVFQPNGVYPKAWDVTGTGRDYTFSPILKPLEHLRDDILLVANLDNVRSGNHVQMTSAFLTGVGVQNGRCAVSADQLIARKIGGDTRLPSIELGTEPPRQGGNGSLPISFANTVSWSSETTRISPEINPRVAFDRLFRTAVDPQARKRAADHRSVLDAVLDDARSIRRQASHADVHKLDEYLESVRSVESRIDRALDPPARSWEPISQPEMIRPASGIPRRRDEHLRLMTDLMVLALWTDSTRVATLMTAHGFSRQNFSFLDGVTSDHHGMSHHKDQESAVKEYTTVSIWYAKQVAYLLDRMKSIDEGGQSLLDNSTVMYGSGMKDGNGHKKQNLPIVIAGRGAGFKVGHHVRLAKPTPLANLHHTLLNQFDIPIESFNGASTGALTELL
ncbi:MAG: DUF1552 domain-containing protein [Pirellulaceae bacterium]|nr:DUF1552 domain-containing protein [Pirellulaceae bacterium]